MDDVLAYFDHILAKYNLYFKLYLDELNKLFIRFLSSSVSINRTRICRSFKTHHFVLFYA